MRTNLKNTKFILITAIRSKGKKSHECELRMKSRKVKQFINQQKFKLQGLRLSI